MLLKYRTLKDVQQDFPSVVGFRYVPEKYYGYVKKRLQFLVSCPLKLISCLYPYKARWVDSGNYYQSEGVCKSCQGAKENSLTFEHGKMIDAINVCQFPGCPETENLVADHIHNLKECKHVGAGGRGKRSYGARGSSGPGGSRWRVCRLCFRGVLCHLHNMAMTIVDKHPELYIGTREGEWINRRPFREEKWHIFT